MAKLGLFLWTILSAGILCPQSAFAENLLFRNFTLIDGRGGEPRPGTTMLVSDGRIVWIGSTGAPPPAQAARTIDLTGKFVTPGLIDTHVHIGNVRDLTQDAAFYTKGSVNKDLATYAAYGITTVAAMGTDKDVIFAIRDQQRSGRPKVARVLTAGQGIVYKNGYGGVPGINHPVDTPAAAIAEVDAQARKGADYIKLWLDDELGEMAKLPPEISQAVISEGHRLGLKVFAHIFYLEDAKRLAAQGVDGFVHSVRDQPIDDDTVALMKEHGTAQVAATLSREASLFTFAGPAPLFDDPFFQRALSADALAGLRSPTRQLFIRRSHGYARLPAFFATAKANTRKLMEAGIPVGAGTDSGPPGRFPGYFAHWELELLVKAGLTPGQALHAATGGAAAIFGLRDVGTLEAAKWADMLVLDRNPLTDIRNTRSISAVYIAGQQVRTVADAVQQ